MLEFFEKPGVVIVLLVVLIVFGAKRLPDSARSLGRSMRIFKSEVKGLKQDDEATPAAAPPLPVATADPVPGAAPVPDPTPVAAHNGHQRV